MTFNPAGSYAVSSLKPDTLYRFSLAARSEMGLGVYTQPIEARTAQSSKYTFIRLGLVPVLFLAASNSLTSDFRVTLSRLLQVQVVLFGVSECGKSSVL